jgi:hypothetical protein
MTSKQEISFEDANPNPEYLIKSIAEQGYSLETSLADLMDNSISAKASKVEVLIDFDSEPFRLFLSDNGEGMTEEELRLNMQFPSCSPERSRAPIDLGRFGLGMKTASFSQTRKFTVLSRKKGTSKYSGRTWDVDFLKENGWKIIVNNPNEVDELINQYQLLSADYNKQFQDFSASTIVVWSGLYKFENYLSDSNRKRALQKEITEVTNDYLALVFHRFMEKDNAPLKIRINNAHVIPFNPFPESEKDFRQIEPRQRPFEEDVIKIEGFVLPSRAIKESKNGLNNWTTKHRGLMDMEGLYIYRADRIILFGGWNGIIKKAPRLQLARLRVEVGNSVDHLLHLNVAKSQIVVPHELRSAFESYIEDLKYEAEREFYNRGIRKFTGQKSTENYQLFERNSSNKGSLLELNRNFPLLKALYSDMSKVQSSKLNLLLRMINTRVNNIRHVHEEKEFSGNEERDGVNIDDLKKNIEDLLKDGWTGAVIKETVIPHLGFIYTTLPEQIKKLL